MVFLSVVSCNAPTDKSVLSDKESIEFRTQEIIAKADEYLGQQPVTITSFKAERSAGGIHDYYSEGSYWWQNPADPSGPYIRRDGQRNPSNFVAHKSVLRNFALKVNALTAAYLITQNEKYAHHAMAHLRAWFVSSTTKMNPSLLYAQAIKGVSTGRGIGIIDTVRLIDVALSVEALIEVGLLQGEDLVGIKKWFNDFGIWLTTHPYGKDEQHNDNNHSTWWGAQVAAYARVADRADLLQISQTQYKEQLAIQMVANGSFPEELSRTRPYHYMNYNLRAWTTFALLASTPKENLWQYESKNGTLEKAIDFALSFIEHPEQWAYQSELEKEIHPKRNDYLLFAYWGLKDKKYLSIWKSLERSEAKNINYDANLVLWQNQLSS